MKFDVNGAAVYAATGGKDFDPSLPALVLVHGAGFDHSIWQQQARYLAHHGYSVLALDLPAHGLSAGEPLPEIGRLAEWIVTVMDAMDLDAATLIGHSMGALGVLEAAARYPARVSALALLGVAGRMPVHTDLLVAAAANDRKAVDLIVGWGHGARTHCGGNIASGIWLLQAGRRLLEKARPGVLSNDLVASDAFNGAEDAASKISCPVLCLLGAHDRMTPPKAARGLIDAFSDVTRVVLPETGHMMTVESPGATLDALNKFLGDKVKK